MTDLDEARGQHAQNEAPSKLHRRNGDGPAVFSAKAHLVFRDIDQTAIGYCDAMGVAGVLSADFS